MHEQKIKVTFQISIVSEGTSDLLGGIAADVSTRKQAKAQLLHEKDFPETAINSLPGVFLRIRSSRMARRSCIISKGCA